MLDVVLESWFTYRFSVRDRSRILAMLDFTLWREHGTILLGGETFRIRREAVLYGDFVLESSTGEWARARKPSAWHRHFEITYGGRIYDLRAENPFVRRHVLLEGGHEIGAVKPRNIWTRRAEACLPEDWPLPVRVFIIWLVLLMWRRAATAAAAS